MGIKLKMHPRAGQLAMEIAQEKLFGKLDPDGAIKSITESFYGITESLVIQILKGDWVIVINEDGKTGEVIQRNPEIHHNYPRVDIIEWYKRKVHEINERGGSILSILERIKRNITDSGFGIQLELDYSTAFKILQAKDCNLLYSLLENQEDISEFYSIVKLVQSFLIEYYRYSRVFEFLGKAFPKDINIRNECVLPDFWRIIRIENELTKLIHLDTLGISKDIEEADAQLFNHIASAIKIDKVLKTHLLPVNIENGYTAGWLAPNGDFFGLNGEISNLLHNQLAEAIRDKMLREEKIDTGPNPDDWLARNGWVRIHRNWILYEGYFRKNDKGQPTPLSEMQINKLKCYGDTCCNGKLLLGSQKKVVSTLQLKATEKLMLSRYFNL